VPTTVAPQTLKGSKMKSALTLAAIALTLSTGNALAHDEDVLQMSPPGAPYI